MNSLFESSEKMFREGDAKIRESRKKVALVATNYKRIGLGEN